MSFNEGIHRIAKAVHILAGIIGGLIGCVFLLAALGAFGNEANAERLWGVLAGAVIYGLGRGLAWIIDGFGE